MTLTAVYVKVPDGYVGFSEHGCELMREGAKHSVNVNPLANRVTTVPRHRELDNFLRR